MKSHSRNARNAPMSADAFAGFLKLWLTPSTRIPRASEDVDAYLEHVSERDPLPDSVRRVLGRPTNQAA